MSENKQNIAANSHNSDVQNESQEEFILNSQIERFYQVLQKLKIFISNLTQEKALEIQNEIIQYSHKEKIIYKSIEQILKLCEKRIQKMIRNKKAKKNWNQDDINILIWVVNKYTSFYAKKSINSLVQEDWKYISGLIPASSWKKCMFKWLSLKKFNLLTFRWSNDQSKILAELIKQKGKKNWQILAERLYVENKTANKVFRTSKQCRQHWNCYLNPSIKKGPWTKKQDIKLLQSVLQLNCMKKWSEVAKYIKGRTQNAVKNRFTLLMDKQKKISGQQNQKYLINSLLVRFIHTQADEVGIKSKQADQIVVQIEAGSQIYQDFQNQRPSTKQSQRFSVVFKQKKTIGALEDQKVEQRRQSKLIIPTVIYPGTLFNLQSFFQVNSFFFPYFCNMMMNQNFQMNQNH